MSSVPSTPVRVSKATEASSPDHFSPGGGEVIDPAPQGLVAKVVMLGDSGVGKTSIVMRYVDASFSESVKTTIGASFFTKKFNIDGVKIKLQLWDTAGQERFRSLTPMFYRGSSAAVLVFDITNEDSFEKLKNWVKELRTNVDESLVLAIAANKADLKGTKRISTRVVTEYAESIKAAVFETSAKDDTGITDMFTAIARQLLQVYRTDGGAFISTQKSQVIPQCANGGADTPESSGCPC